MLQPRLSVLGCGSGKMGNSRNTYVQSLRICFIVTAVILSSTFVSCQELSKETIEASRIKRESVPENRAFNTKHIVYDNTPWRPGRDLDLIDKEEENRKFKNLATRIMSNGVEVLVKDKNPDSKQDQVKYKEIKTIHPTSSSSIFHSNLPKINKRIDNQVETNSFDLIQPSEVDHVHCVGTCTCSNIKTESLSTKKTSHNMASSQIQDKYGNKLTKYKVESTATTKNPTNKETNYGPYEYESNLKLAPTDKIVEKYTEVINDYSDEKDSVEQSDLLTNEEAPIALKTNNVPSNKNPDKSKPEKPQKPSKNKVVADLLKLGSLSIKGLSQLAPVIEKMTGGFIKRHDTNKNITSTEKTVTRITPYKVNKRVDSELDSKNNNFPIYIPMSELETSESQTTYTNVTLHQNLAWAVGSNNPKAHIVIPKIVHESPLVNGGIPISPGEIITANSDVIVGKPAVGGPLTLAASGIKLQNPGKLLHVDSFVSANEPYMVSEKVPVRQQSPVSTKIDDSFDLRPPELPKPKLTPNRSLIKPPNLYFDYHNLLERNRPPVQQIPDSYISDEFLMKTEQIKSGTAILGNHGRPAYLDYIPSLAKPDTNMFAHLHKEYQTQKDPSKDLDVLDNSPSSSEIIATKVLKAEENIPFANSELINKPFLVDIQPSRVANVIIPHGSSTALVFAGSSEPHKTGDYVDDPLPYPEPGYFGSFSIDAPQMTNVHNVLPSNMNVAKSESYVHHSGYKQIAKTTFKEHKQLHKIPPPTSNQETHVLVGPQITAYNPEIFNPDNDFLKYEKNPEHEKGVIDKEYENFLAVPPPPPPKRISETTYEKNKYFNQRPIVHTKPIQDMKVFLNVQHPIPNISIKEQVPPKVTSEIYFAAQVPNNKPSSTYTIHLKPSNSFYPDTYNNANNRFESTSKENSEKSHTSYTDSMSLHPFNNSNSLSDIYNKVPNTDKNVVSNIKDTVHLKVTDKHSSSVDHQKLPVDQINTDIPIGTNVAIRVEDGSPLFANYNSQTIYAPIQSEKLNNTTLKEDDIIWNKGSNNVIKQDTFNIYGHNSGIDNLRKTTEQPSVFSSPTSFSSFNSHANFPMINEYTAHNADIRPVVENADDIKLNDQKRPPKVMINVPSNSHEWYSSLSINENPVNNLNNIKVDTTKIIPLNYDYHTDSVPDYGQKISNIGKPPTEFWSQNIPPILSNIGKPFTKPQRNIEQHSKNSPKISTQAKPHYISTNLGDLKQAAYDIPIRDNSDETTTIKTSSIKNNSKPIYEDADEIYDGEEGIENDADSEVSLESMKIPVISTSKKNESKDASNEILIKDEVKESPNNDEVKQNKLSFFNPGSQTEIPFSPINKTQMLQHHTIKPTYNINAFMKPKPFTVHTTTILDHQLQQPHWQINELMENSTNVSYEENLELNLGEEIKTITTTKSPKIPSQHSVFNNNHFKPPHRPVFSVRPNISDDPNIITSTIHIHNKKPLTVEVIEKPTVSTIVTVHNDETSNSSSEILDLSPPPPTMDNNFKPSTNDEMIMGMSPPPPKPSVRVPLRTSTTRSVIPIRTATPYKTKPIRTFPPRVPTLRPTRKPINRDDVSTYRPAYDIINKIKRPSSNEVEPSLQLSPPPKLLSFNTVFSSNNMPIVSIKIPTNTNIVFPTPTSSGWLTSSGVDFSSSFDFSPTPLHFPQSATPIPASPNETSSNEYSSSLNEESYSSESEPSSESFDYINEELPLTEIEKENVRQPESKLSNSVNISDPVGNESAEQSTTDEVKIVSILDKYKIQKPTPVRNDDKKPSRAKYKPSSKSVLTIQPTKTLSSPEILHPSRKVSIKKIIRPVTQSSITHQAAIIESSESITNGEYIRPTEVLNDDVSTLTSSEIITPKPSVPVDKFSSSNNKNAASVNPTHHSGNEVKISDEIVPTKTEYKTTIVTLTKTLLEPPKTVSSIGYVNLTHTLTVTHTMTSLISQSEGAVTQTLVLTNTHTSTVVDVVTEIHTQVQPTTIIETITKHIPVPQVEPTPVQEVTTTTKVSLDDITMSSEEQENFIIKDNDTTENIQHIETDNENDNDTFFVVMNKSQNGGESPSVNTDIETNEYDGVTRNEQINNNGVSQVLFGEILLAGAPYLETTNIVNPTGNIYRKECQPDCKASRNERCQRIDGIMKCVCRPGFARMFPDRPCKPTYTYSVKLALASQGNRRLEFQESFADNSSKEYHDLALVTHEGINRMVMQSNLRDVFQDVYITGYQPVEISKDNGNFYQGIMSDFYVQLSDNAYESRLKKDIEKYLRNNNYSIGGTDLIAAGELMDKIEVSDFDECISGQFHDCSEHAQCFNLRGTYTCSCLEGFADLSVNSLYPGRICSAEPVGCERCNYHGACYSRDDHRVLCECFPWYSGSSCQINLKVVLISLVVVGALLTVVLVICAVVACSRRRPQPPPHSIVACIQGMPGLQQNAMPSKQRADRRALISERGESGDASSGHNISLPYMPAKRPTSSKKCIISDPPAHDPPPPPPAVIIPRARLHQHHHGDSRDNVARKRSVELSSEEKLISYLESGASKPNDEMRRKHSMESSYSANKERNKQGALVSAGFKVSTTVHAEEPKAERDDASSINKADLEAELARFDSLRKSYSQEELSEWTDAERRLGALTLSEARSVGGTLPASTGRAASSTRLTHQDANTMAERDLGSTFLLPHVHLYKSDLTSDVSEFDSL